MNSEMVRRHKLGISRAWERWRFLFISAPDVNQTVWLTVCEHPKGSRQEFIRALSRNLYRLARDLGFRQLAEANEQGFWWEREELSFRTRLRGFGKLDKCG